MAVNMQVNRKFLSQISTCHIPFTIMTTNGKKKKYSTEHYHLIQTGTKILIPFILAVVAGRVLERQLAVCQ